MQKEQQNIKKKSMGIILLVSIIFILVGSLGASYVQRSFGKTDMTKLVFPTQNGQWVAADLFKPKVATKDSKKPVVVLVPGFQRSKETLANISVELSRRGINVICIDPYAQGASSSSFAKKVATEEAYGAIAVIDYITNTPNLNYIDKDKIVVIGHSAGGNASLRAAAHYGKIAEKTGEKSKVHSIFMSGYVLTLKKNILKDVKSNIGIGYALYDEGAFRNETKTADMKKAPESLRLINMILPEDQQIEEVEIGKFYGEKNDNTLRVVYNENALHATQPYDPISVSSIIEYTEKVLEIEPQVASMNQIWLYKDFFNLLALLGGLLMIIPTGFYMLEIPFFKELVHPIPKALPKPATAKGKTVFWALFIISALIAAISFVPLAQLSQKIFIEASQSQQTWFFPQRMSNAVMMWAVFNGTLGILIFTATYFISGKKNGITPDMWGVKTNIKEILKTLLAALLIFGVFYSILFLIYDLLHVDYRFLFNSARVFDLRMLKVSLMYVPVFFIFYISNSLRVNGSLRFEGSKEWKNILLCCLANTLGLITIFLIQYIYFYFNNTVFWQEEWLYINLLFGVIPIMFILPIYNRIFFRMTGKIYLGAMTTCMIFIMMMLTNSVCYIPV